MNEQWNNQNNNYDSYEFSTPIDPAPVDQTIYNNQGQGDDPKKPNKKKSGTGKKFGLCIALALTFGLVGGGTFLGVSAVGSNLLGLNRSTQTTTESSTPRIGSTQQDSTSTTTATVASDNNSGELTIAEVTANTMPAMVSITNISIQEVPNIFGYSSQNYQSQSSGSGIIIDQNDEEVLIATNNHVVADSTSLTVSFVDGQLVEGSVKGTSAENDLAVVAVKIADIPQATLDAIKVIQMGSSDDLQMGEQVIAIGNALGLGQSVSTGILSAKDRQMTIDGHRLTLLQTDTAINPGNSGGALLNMKGELVGINESKLADTRVEGMGFAIPITTATEVLNGLISQEERTKVPEDQASYLGVTCKDLSAELTQLYGVPAGVYIDTVVEGAPAQKAGIQQGDILSSLDGVDVDSYAALTDRLSYYAAGETVTVVVHRANDGTYESHELTVTLASKVAATTTSQSNSNQ